MWVLVVDDSVANTIFVKQALQSLGHAAMCNSSPEAALAMLGSMEFDVILVDYHMPGMNALQFMDALGAQRGAGQVATPVVVMTADVSADLEPSVISRGASSVVYKPLGLGELASALEKASTRSP